MKTPLCEKVGTGIRYICLSPAMLLYWLIWLILVMVLVLAAMIGCAAEVVAQWSQCFCDLMTGLVGDFIGGLYDAILDK